MEFQKSGFFSGWPYCVISSSRQRRALEGIPGGGELPRLRQLLIRSGYEATTPAQMTPALTSLETTIERKVICPPMEWPHMPIRSGSASGYFLIEARALS